MIGPARPGMERGLKRLWQACFHEPDRPVDFYLRNAYRPENCLVYLHGGKLVSAVHLLPCRILTEEGPAPAHYIYAAATLPEYRGHGFMASLLAYAALYGAGRGQRYSAVLPAEPGLYSLYEKAGYQPYFRLSVQEIPADLLRGEAAPAARGRRLAGFPALCLARDRSLAGRPGSVLWDAAAFFYAAGSSRLYGGKLLAAGWGRALSYAMASAEGGACTVTEWTAAPAARRELLGLLLRELPAKTYRFRLPEGSPLVLPGHPAEGAVFGMIKPLGGAVLPEASPAAPPYLGLSLD